MPDACVQGGGCDRRQRGNKPPWLRAGNGSGERGDDACEDRCASLRPIQWQFTPGFSVQSGGQKYLWEGHCCLDIYSM